MVDQEFILILLDRAETFAGIEQSPTGFPPGRWRLVLG
jgi:hypothetical protein